MAQLQLYLTQSRNGFASLGNVNPSEDVARRIHDPAHALDILRYDASVPQVFYLLTYFQDGLMFSVLRPLPGNLGDNTAATIFFPAGVSIDFDAFNTVITFIRTLLLSCETPAAKDMSVLRKFFATDFPVDREVARMTPSSGHSYAFARFGGAFPSLSDYFGARFFQPGFSRFAGVLLVDSLSKAEPREHSFDISGPLSEVIVVRPPLPTPEGFQPYIGHMPFDRPVIAGKGDTLDIVWRRSGFESLPCQFTVGGNVDDVPQCDTSAARKVITPASFYVSAQNNGEVISDFTVSVNGTEIKGPQPFNFSELENARVDIEAPGYFRYNGTVDLASTTQAIVRLRKQHSTYRFDMPLRSSEPLEPLHIYIKSLRPLRCCPVEGYSVVGGKIAEGGEINRLEYAGGLRRRVLFIVAVVAALGVGFALGAAIFAN